MTHHSVYVCKMTTVCKKRKLKARKEQKIFSLLKWAYSHYYREKIICNSRAVNFLFWPPYCCCYIHPQDEITTMQRGTVLTGHGFGTQNRIVSSCSVVSVTGQLLWEIKISQMNHEAEWKCKCMLRYSKHVIWLQEMYNNVLT